MFLETITFLKLRNYIKKLKKLSGSGLNQRNISTVTTSNFLERSQNVIFYVFMLWRASVTAVIP